jgi:hypothetical protein
MGPFDCQVLGPEWAEFGFRNRRLPKKEQRASATLAVESVVVDLFPKGMSEADERVSDISLP